MTWEEGAGAACGESFHSWRELIGVTFTEGVKDRTSETCLHVDKRRSKDDSRVLGLDDSDYGWVLTGGGRAGSRTSVLTSGLDTLRRVQRLCLREELEAFAVGLAFG